MAEALLANLGRLSAVKVTARPSQCIDACLEPCRLIPWSPVTHRGLALPPLLTHRAVITLGVSPSFPHLKAHSIPVKWSLYRALLRAVAKLSDTNLTQALESLPFTASPAASLNGQEVKIKSTSSSTPNIAHSSWAEAHLAEIRRRWRASAARHDLSPASVAGRLAIEERWLAIYTRLSRQHEQRLTSPTMQSSCTASQLSSLDARLLAQLHTRLEHQARDKHMNGLVEAELVRRNTL